MIVKGRYIVPWSVLLIGLVFMCADRAEAQYFEKTLPRYTAMTNYYIAVTNRGGGISTNQYSIIEFETGIVSTNRVYTETNYVGRPFSCIYMVTTNQWGLPVTNRVNPAYLRSKVKQDMYITADSMDFDRDTKWAEAKGKVVIRKGQQVLTAVYARVNTETEDAYAAGNVRLVNGGNVWKGTELTYNFRTREGATDAFTGTSSPFRIIGAGSAQKETNGFYMVQHTTMTTCTNEYPHCHYHLKSRKIRIKPGRIVRGWGATYYLAGIPVLYLPYWKADLRPDFGWRVYPGHSSKLGTFLLTSYKYRMTPVFRGETHADFMSEKGVAFGQDLKWGLTNGIPVIGLKKGAGYGDLETYYLDDSKPIDDDEDKATADIDNDRYRILLRNIYTFASRDYTMLNASYLSDTDVLEDFFEDEYRVYHTPDNYFIYSHNGDEFTAGLTTRFRLNDFFQGVNRLPEAYVEFLPQQVGESYFFYEGRTAASYLEKVHAVGNTGSTDYAAFRFDTLHDISRPQKFFGFLNVVPSIGYRGTYYSETRDTTNWTQIVTRTNYVVGSGVTNIQTTTSTNSYSRDFPTEAMYRNVFRVGSEFSFKAFKQWGGDIKPRRHVVEPYVRYTYVAEPDVLPDRLYQFDSIDSEDASHSARLGVRNKLQRKIRRPLGYSPYDILDIDVYTVYNLDPAPREDPLQDVWIDADWQPSLNFSMDMDAKYNLEENDIDSFNVRALVSITNTARSSLEFRYRTKSSSLLFGDLSLWPDRQGWSPSVYARYEFEESRMEEAGFYLRRTLDCMVIRTGIRVHPGYTRPDGTEKEAEYRGTLEFWLTAFPDFGVKRRRSRYSRTDGY